jgi:glycosyltransferase involved in cell wall biosynthesis
MKIGIYLCNWGQVGGGQFYIGSIAEVLSSVANIEIVHHTPDINKSHLEEMMQLDLSRVDFRYFPGEFRPFAACTSASQRIQQEKDWSRAISEPYDLFINCTHPVPSPSYAKNGVLVSLFPFEDYETFYGMKAPAWQQKNRMGRLARQIYARSDWKKRFKSYGLNLTTSQFVQHWLQKLWQIDAKVLYPPVRSGFTNVHKSNHIISIGRFHDAAFAHHKRQDVMIDAYKGLYRKGLKEWPYKPIGALLQEDHSYFERLIEEAHGYPIELIANASSAELKQNLETAKIFWHAAGFGQDAERHPERMEHFGITTVEAMAAGCVPIVINQGGQREIVQHGINGFLWDTVEQLQEFTLQLTYNDDLLQTMSQAARARAAHFSQEAFAERCLKLFRPLLHT